MRKILFNLIIIIALLGNINIAEAQYAHPATAIKSANGNVQNDLNTLQANIASNTQEVALITSEIEAINQNLATHEAELASITAEINLMSVNLGTIEIRLDSIETNILSMIEPAITELRLNLSTIEDLINSNYNSLFANLGTHETLINDNFLTLHTNIGTLEAKLVADKAELFNNISTLETALRDNLTTLEAKLVADKLELYTNIGTLEAKLTADKIELYNNLLTHEVSINSILLNLSTHETLITDNFNTLYANLQTHEIELAAITNEINLLNINLGTVEDRLNGFTLNFNTIEIELGSISVAINNLDLQLGIIELALSGGISGEVFTRTSNGFTWATPASGVTDHLLLSNIGTKTHLELEQDILDLQANPAGISRVYIDGVALATGEVEFIAGANISLNVIGNTVEIESSGGGQTAEVNFVEKLNYSTREQGTSEAGFYSIYKFNLPVSGTVLNSISCYLNGLKQDKGAGLDYIVDTWDNGGVSSYKVVFNKDLDENDLVAISYFINNTVIVGSAFEEVASYISDNTIWEATTTYDYSSTAVYRNGLKQNKSSYTMPTVAAKSRIVFNSAINATDEVIITGVAGSGSAEDIATYVSDNTIWDFTSNYDTLKVYIYRNGVYQKRSLFTTSVVSDKLRVTFGSAINTTDEISLIHIQ